MAVVVMRIAGGPDVGYGHLRRSWTLAEHLVQAGVQVQMVTASSDGIEPLAASGFPVSVEAQLHQIDQTLSVLRQARVPAVCVVDDPGMTPDRLSALRNVAPVVCLDDTGERAMPVDLVVNGSAGAEELRYRGLSETAYLLGSRYILLRKEFAQDPIRAAIPAEVQRVLLLTGGGRTGDWPHELATLVAATLPRAIVDVVVGPFSERPGYREDHAGRVRWHRTPADLRALMLEADLAVSAGGQTLYELAAAAVPTIGVRLVANQALNLRGLAAHGCLTDVGSPEETGFSTRLTAALGALSASMDRRRKMGERGRHLVDGLGARRVAAYVEERLLPAGPGGKPASCVTPLGTSAS